MRAHYLQHVPFESPGSILTWLTRHGAVVTSTQLYEPHRLPTTDDFDLLIVMGGPMSVNDEADYPWLVAEKRLVREAIEQRLAVLGVCLGAQVIASALGCRVYPNPVREIGWFPISAALPSAARASGWPEEAIVFHWHGETFDLPPGAVRLASSEGCLNQAFQIGDRVVGLQFHLEATPESVREMVTHGRHELTVDRYVQSEPELLATPRERYVRPNQIMDDVLERVTARPSTRSGRT